MRKREQSFVISIANYLFFGILKSYNRPNILFGCFLSYGMHGHGITLNSRWSPCSNSLYPLFTCTHLHCLVPFTKHISRSILQIIWIEHESTLTYTNKRIWDNGDSFESMKNLFTVEMWSKVTKCLHGKYQYFN